MAGFDEALAGRLATIALGHVEREYPYAPGHVMAGPDDIGRPRVYHPTFFGSFDWHSSVHAHWCLARLLRLFPQLASASAIRARFDRGFTDKNIQAEHAYFERPMARGFERPYGWAWLLMLTDELRRLTGREGQGWAAAIAPLEHLVALRFERFLSKADYPIRAGTHGNTAFALALALEWARSAGAIELARLIEAKARAWHDGDRDCQAWEPSGDDFLSSALMEAELMRRVMTESDFRSWFAGFLPRSARGEPATLFSPARVSDRSDGKLAHLDGLNLSRAWCWRGIASSLATHDPARARALEAAERHLDAALPHLAADYAGEHWLASFALLALDRVEPGRRP
ncbi:MAG TPA: DUF2891 domain-containing protein [Caulobacteraceae bacterium]|nr:DUF2891 domain-containing protein [Caulobacteraceae bacterium]